MPFRRFVTCGDVLSEIRFCFLPAIPCSKDPNYLVAQAKKLRADDDQQARAHGDEYNRFSRVYVVTDVDDFVPQLLRLRTDRRALEGIDLIISNPCFEVWLVCHKTQPDRDRRRVQQQAKDLGLVTGPNGKMPVLGELTDVGRAEQTARHLRADHDGNGHRFPDDAPSTGVDLIIACLREASAGAR